MLLDPERILADQFARHPRDALFLGAVEFVAGDPGDARVGVDAEVREPDLCFDAPGRPRRMERLRQRDVDLARADLRDAHGLPPQGGRGNGVPRPPGVYLAEYPRSVSALTAKAMASLLDAPCAARANMLGMMKVW